MEWLSCAALVLHENDCEVKNVMFGMWILSHENEQSSQKTWIEAEPLSELCLRCLVRRPVF